MLQASISLSLSLFFIQLHSITTSLQCLHPLRLRDRNIFQVINYRVWALGLEYIKVMQMLALSSSLFHDMYHPTPRASRLQWRPLRSTRNALALFKAATKWSSYRDSNLSSNSQFLNINALTQLELAIMQAHGYVCFLI